MNNMCYNKNWLDAKSYKQWIYTWRCVTDCVVSGRSLDVCVPVFCIFHVVNKKSE